MSIVTETKVICDVTGEEVPGETGWVLVRRYDGKEVAHFNSLSSILEEARARRIFDAAWLASKETE